jgi:hypothetical protein
MDRWLAAEADSTDDDLAGNIVTAQSLLPSYLRLPQAERELKFKKPDAF